ncbi:MAG: SLOG family protein, partial [Thermoanaerobaculia bacterium]
MRVIIAGSRSATTQDVRKALDTCAWIDLVTSVVSGTAAGADQAGERWAEERGLPVTRFPAEWEKFGKRAGPLRNKQMAENAEALIAVWDGASRGTSSMIELARERGLRVHVHLLDGAKRADVAPNGSPDLGRHTSALPDESRTETSATRGPH